MIKRIIAMILTVVMLMPCIGVYADNGIVDDAMSILKNKLEIMRLRLDNAEAFVNILGDLIELILKEFKDIKASDWFKDNLAILYGMNIVQGDGLGNFLPNKQVTGSEYLKMVVVALDRKTYKPVDGLWDEPYIDRALDLGLVEGGEIKNYREPLNRYQMARIIVRACNEEFDDYEQYKGSVKDYNSIPDEFKEYVLKAYSKGIINGLPDGTFGGNNTMKRSEAIAVIARLIVPSQRKTPVKPVSGGSSSTVKLKNPEMQMLVDNISGLVVPEGLLGDVIVYKENGKPTLYKCDLSLNDDDDTIYLTIERRSEKTLAKAREILKMFYPNSYERVYQAVLDAYATDAILDDTVMDGRTVYVMRGESVNKACIQIGREVKK